MTDTTQGTHSPFETTDATRSRRLLRTGLSAAFVLVAVIIALLMTRDTPEATATTDHSHAAPAGGSAATAVSLDADAARRIGVSFAEVTSGPMTAKVLSERLSGSVPPSFRSNTIDARAASRASARCVRCPFQCAALSGCPPLIDRST